MCKKSSPVTGLEWPRGFQEVKVPRFQDCMCNTQKILCRALCPADAGFLSDEVTVLEDTLKGTFFRYIATNIWRTCP